MKPVSLVISGGGAKGAFAVGVIDYLYNRYSINNQWFDQVGGTSTGALIAPFAALLHHKSPYKKEVLSTLIQTYKSVTTKDILKSLHFWEYIFRQDTINTTGPLKKLIKNSFKEEWFYWLQTNNDIVKCYVTSVDLKSGNCKDIIINECNNREEWITYMLASASVPIFMNSQIVGSEVLYDGGLRDITPIDYAINSGSETIVTINLSPEYISEADSSLDRMDRILMRTIDIMSHEISYNDMNTARAINSAIKVKTEILNSIKNDADIYNKLKEIFDKDEYENIYRNKRLLNIIDVRPNYPLTENSLEFDPTEMSAWMFQGNYKAQRMFKNIEIF